MKLKRSPLSVALITLAICAGIGIIGFLVFGDHTYTPHHEEKSFAFGQALAVPSAIIAAIAYFVQRRRVNAQWAQSIEGSAGSDHRLG